MTKIMPKGIVEPTEMRDLCNKMRILLSNRKNVALNNDWAELERLTKLMRCFTTGEGGRIELLFGLYEGYKQKEILAEREGKK